MPPKSRCCISLFNIKAMIHFLQCHNFLLLLSVNKIVEESIDAGLLSTLSDGADLRWDESVQSFDLCIETTRTLHRTTHDHDTIRVHESRTILDRQITESMRVTRARILVRSGTVVVLVTTIQQCTTDTGDRVLGTRQQHLWRGSDVFTAVCLSVCQQDNAKRHRWIFGKIWVTGQLRNRVQLIKF